MPTVIDSLVITLGLDPKAFQKGQKEATAAFQKTRDAAEKSGKDIESSSAKAAESIDRIARNALKLYAVFTAGRGIKEFVEQVTSADAALGRLARNIGSTPDTVSAFTNAVERGGGSADAAAQSIQSFTDAIQEIKLTGTTGILDDLNRAFAMAGKRADFTKPAQQQWEDMADVLKSIKDTRGIAAANLWGRRLGFDQGTVNFLMQGGAAVHAATEESKRLGVTTQFSADAAQKFQTALVTLKQASESLGRTILTNVTPYIVDLLKQLQAWIEKNKDWIDTQIVEKVKEFAAALPGIIDGIKNFVGVANQAAQAVGGWAHVCEALFALWAGEKFLRMLANIGLLWTALRGGGGAGVGLLGLLGAGGAGLASILGLSLGSDLGTSNAEKPGVITRSDDDNTNAAPLDAGGIAGAARRTWNWMRGRGWRESGARPQDHGVGHGAPGVPYSATSFNAGVGVNDQQYNAFKEGVAQVEHARYNQMGGASNRFAGRYQMGRAEITETAKRLGESAPTTQQFLNDPAMQERYFANYSLDHHNTLMRYSAAYRALSPEQKLQVLGYAHNQGAGGAIKYLQSGRAGSDSFGTSGTAYFGPIRSRLGALKKEDAAGGASLWAGNPNAYAYGSSLMRGADAAAYSRMSTVNSNNNTSSANTTIGNITVNTQASDASGIARDIGPAIKRNAFTTAADYGQW